MYSNSNSTDLHFNHFLSLLIKKNLFTQRQISIIYNKANNRIFKDKVSSGAYYRQIKQCKRKYDQLIYTILLFRILNLIDSNTINILDSIVNQIGTISHQNLDENSDITNSYDIIEVIDEIIKKTRRI
jgi:hypothetical protein